MDLLHAALRSEASCMRFRHDPSAAVFAGAWILAERRVPASELMPIFTVAIPFHAIAMGFVIDMPMVPSAESVW